MQAQKQLHTRYTALLTELSLKSEYSFGYDVYLENEIVSVFILLFLTFAVPFIFLHDASGWDDLCIGDQNDPGISRCAG
jgi:hypothetical protein